MCELFPELSEEIVRYILRDGIIIEQDELDFFGVLECLSELGIIRISEYTFVKCSHQQDYDFRYREKPKCEGIIEISDKQDIYICPECGQSIENISRKTHFVKYQVNMNPEGIEQYLLNALILLESTKSVNHIGPAVYNALMINEVRLKIIAADITPGYRKQAELQTRSQLQSAGFFFAEPILYIISSPINEPTKTLLEVKQYIGLTDLLTLSRNVIEERVLIAATPLEERYSFSEIESAFNRMITRHPGNIWQSFEQEFVPALLHHITQNPALVDQYLQRLRRLSGTIFGYYYVPVGGSGQPDFIPIDKFKLMSELFQGNVEGDAKCYLSTTLSDDDMAKIVYHLERNKSGATKSVVFVAGNEVASTAWTGMMDLEQDGNWQVIIVPKYLILELIVAIKAEDLLCM